VVHLKRRLLSCQSY